MRRKASLKPFFEPKTIAVVGTSRRPNKPGHVIFTNLLRSGFKGKVYPVNPKADEIAGAKCYSNIRKIPRIIDLAVVSVPALAVPQVMRDCVAKKVKGAIIISSGFGESGQKGKKLEDEVRVTIKNAKIRVMGPNCTGVYDSYTSVDTLFCPRHRSARPPKGSIAFISQGGTYGSTVLDWMAARGIGMSKFADYGNMIDVNEIDLLEYLEDDPKTRVIIMHIEQTANGRRLMEVAKRIVPKKPIIALKAGRTAAGAQAALSHTGALAGSDQAYDAAFRQSGIVRANVSDELFDFALALSSQPPAKNNRIAVITNGGGLGVILTDNIIYREMCMAGFSPETKRNLRRKLPPRVNVDNPVDLTGNADKDCYKTALNLVLKDPNVDGAIVVVLFQLPTIEEDVIDVITEANAKYDKPIIVCAYGGGFAEKCAKKLQLQKIPCYPTPDRAARAMKGLVWYGRYTGKEA